MTLSNEFEEGDFTAGEWGQLALARKYENKGEWWRLLRVLCGYTAGRHKLAKRMAFIVDQWLAQHPSWTGRYE